VVEARAAKDVKNLSEVGAEDYVGELWQGGAWEEQGQQRARHHMEEHTKIDEDMMGLKCMHEIRVEAWRVRRIRAYGGTCAGVLDSMQRVEAQDRSRSEWLRIRTGISCACMQYMCTHDDPRGTGGGGDLS
jgi:hypothetical protein